MTPEEILDDAVMDTGWTESEQRKLLLDFIEEMELVDEFDRFVQARADDDSSYSQNE